MLIVFGGINVDGVLTTTTLPALGETVVGAAYHTHPGGKGANQAVAAARAGAPVTMVGCVGADPHAQIPLDAFACANVDTAQIRVVDDAPTAYASVWVDGAGNNQIIVASGANFSLSADQLCALALGPSTTVVFQLEVPLDENIAAIGFAHRSGARVILNAAPFVPLPEEVLHLVDVLVVNEVEAGGFTGLNNAGDNPGDGASAADGLAAGRALSERLDLSCIVTLGAGGAVLFQDGLALAIPTLCVDAIDTTGAGDTFVGVLAGALDEGVSLPDATRLGCAAGALACTRLGAQSGMPDRCTISEHLSQLGPTVPWGSRGP
ncbi:MAG: ribokinase [Gammaproteobacteria bacterium]